MLHLSGLKNSSVIQGQEAHNTFEIPNDLVQDNKDYAGS